ncbi:amino acid adenylation domain-containing protein [Micromonospora sp. WMMD1082]|uniref:amino acid adenylation domain-containing protein n=1 Tax=Micromonospora sp. WMMD1082 TaxID=3016104 RepID=UPI002415F87A|nr:amino acid adenylation domain-containing protein [Micromonospora sp. WMMD1082]MDG4797026.1 amino acid adenylation domain-containing protein [Micromonospora sp. WMMD1082]
MTTTSAAIAVPQLVWPWIRRAPHAPAVRHGARSRDYRAVAGLARAVADRLADAGIRAEDRVALLADRGVDLPGALLGIAASGAVCVPMDATHPAERLGYVAADAQARLVLTDGARPVPPALAGLPVLRLDTLAPAPGEIGFDGHQHQLAYVLYTSGSTGRPKGVGVTHGALVNCLTATARALAYAPGERWLAVTPPTFDIAMLELLLPLCAGGQVEIAGREEARSGPALARLLAATTPRYLHATPLTWQLLFTTGWTGAAGLVALIGGDRVPPALGGRLAECVERVHHLYGPTEATMYAVSDIVRPGPPPAVLPIGVAIPGTRAVVLDPALHPVPPGTVGELCLGGACLARGYLGRPALTAQRFVPDPDHPGERLYRTGDRARLLPDGRLELRGRADDQVKIRGHRIELGEIENVMSEHPDVAVAAAVVVPAGADQRLVGYVQLRPAAPVTALDTLRAYLCDRLPGYLRPAAIGALRTMPTTTTGKVDRAALARIRLP